ncbi:hypothetical protein RV17_GL000917 [Enterococcus thailandicus]|nr:hypothetical protein RV17_GL000917 [Enterococcus thailandicus]
MRSTYMRIFICEDEKDISLKLQSICETILCNLNQPDYEIEVYNDGETLAQYYQLGKRADLIFLDIELGNNSGIDVSRKIRQLDKSVKIVFATNYRNYKDEAFSVHAFGYIEKPFHQIDIETIITEFIQYSIDEEKTLIKLSGNNGDFLVDKNDILYIENRNRKLILVCFSGSYPITGKISKLGNDLKEFGFHSPHVSFLVNLDYVRRIKNYTVYMTNDCEIPLSQKKSSIFRKVISQHLRHIIHSHKGENK